MPAARKATKKTVAKKTTAKKTTARTTTAKKTVARRKQFRKPFTAQNIIQAKTVKGFLCLV